jgi:WS/DGAT/MGAT family acyltransferase
MASNISMMDLMFLLTEKPEVPRHVGAVLIFRRPRVGGARAARDIVHAYRRARPRPPCNRIPVIDGTGLPEWREVDEIDPSQHVLHLHLPAPGTDRQLHELIAELHEPLLDRHRPGWQICVIEGLDGDRFAIYHKCHHSLVDGELGMTVLRRSLSTSPQDRRIRPIAVPAHNRPRPRKKTGLLHRIEAGTGRLAVDALSMGLGSLQAIARVFDGMQGYSSSEARAFTAPHTPMNAPIRGARSIAHMVLPLTQMKAVAHARKATLNEVALAILDEAMQRHLRDTGRTPDRPLVAICPVALHDPGVKRAANRLSIILAPLGDVSARVDRRLQQIAARTRVAKAQLVRLGPDAAYAYTVATFVLTQALQIARPALRGSAMLLGNAVVSNVRGPAERLYLNGARLDVIFPVSVLDNVVGLNIVFISYADRVIFGFTANASALPDMELLTRHAQDAFADLERVTLRRSAGRRNTVAR